MGSSQAGWGILVSFTTFNEKEGTRQLENTIRRIYAAAQPIYFNGRKVGPTV